VRLQAITNRVPYRVVGGGPVEQLPATPGTYTFALPAGRALRIGDYRDVSLAVAQEVGRHAILVRPTPMPEYGPLADPAQLWRADVFAPALADDAQNVTPAQALAGTKLAVSMIEEADTDQDGLGDETQDVGDLKLVSARIVRRHASSVDIVARVKNVGTTVRNHVFLPDTQIAWECQGTACVKDLAPGAEAEFRTSASTYLAEPTKLVVRAEGPDLTPADNTLPLAPSVTLAKPSDTGAGVAGIRVRVALGHGGTVRLSARAAGLRFGRAFTFAYGHERTIRLTPKSAADRRRLARALERPGRLAALITADAGGGAQRLRLKV
jgi:hypothetical protein